MPGACPPPEVANGYGAESLLSGYEEATRAKSRSSGVFPEENPAATLGKEDIVVECLFHYKRMHCICFIKKDKFHIVIRRKLMFLLTTPFLFPPESHHLVQAGLRITVPLPQPLQG